MTVTTASLLGCLHGVAMPPSYTSPWKRGRSIADFQVQHFARWRHHMKCSLMSSWFTYPSPKTWNDNGKPTIFNRRYNLSKLYFSIVMLVFFGGSSCFIFYPSEASTICLMTLKDTKHIHTPPKTTRFPWSKGIRPRLRTKHKPPKPQSSNAVSRTPSRSMTISTWQYFGQLKKMKPSPMSSNAVGRFNVEEGKIQYQPYDTQESLTWMYNSMPTQGLNKEDWWTGSRPWNNPAVTFFLKVKLTYIQDHKPVAWVTRIIYSSHLCFKTCRLQPEGTYIYQSRAMVTPSHPQAATCEEPHWDTWQNFALVGDEVLDLHHFSHGLTWHILRWFTPWLNLSYFFDFWILLVTSWKSPFKGTFEDDFPIPQVGYVSSLEGTLGYIWICLMLLKLEKTTVTACLIETYIVEVEYGSHGMLGLWKSQNLHIKSHDATDHWWSTGWTLETNDAWYHDAFMKNLKNRLNC